MGLFSRFGKKNAEKQEPAVEPVEPNASPSLCKVTVRAPAYFKQGAGEYHIIVDGDEHLVEPWKSFDIELCQGTHSFRIFSTPETLGDVTAQIEILKDVVLSVTVNVKRNEIAISDGTSIHSFVDNKLTRSMQNQQH